MTIIERIDADFMKAYKNKDMERKNFLGFVRGEMSNSIGRGMDSTDGSVIKILRTIEKNLQTSIDGGDASLIGELQIVRGYLPAMMSEDEIRSKVVSLIGEGRDNIGSVMKSFNELYAGRADNKIVSAIAKSELC